MGWKLKGQMLEACSCKMMCRCTLGPAEPDQGWCSAAITFDIAEGSADGVNLSGRTVVLALDFPGDFFSGNGTARLFLDDGADAKQAGELEAIWTGKKGGPMEALSTAITTWLPRQSAKIEIKSGEPLSIQIGSVGQVTLQPLKDAAGKPTRLLNAMANSGMVETTDLAASNGSRFAAPDMRSWEAGGHGGVSPFSWSA